MGEEKVEAASQEVNNVEESVMSLDALKEAYVAKNAEMKEKYKNLINAIAIKQGVDVGVAFDMLKAVFRGGANYLEGVEVEFDPDELIKDCSESMELSVKIADALGK